MTLTTASNQPNRKHNLFRATTLAAAIAFGTATTFTAVTYSAQAFAMHAGGHDSRMMGMHGHSPEEMHKHFDKVLTEAGATDAQKQQIHAIMKDAMDAEHADMKSFHANFGQMKTLLTADTIDVPAIDKVRDQQDQLLLATSHRVTDALVAVAKVLNPAQRAKLGTEIDKMMKEHEGHHHDM